MKVDEWLQFFKQHPQKKMFSLSDISQLINESRSSLSVQLTRLLHTNVITRVAHGWYANPFHPPSLEEVAMVLRVPSYLSLEYALSRQGILSQRVYTLTVITTRPPYTFHGAAGEFEYHQIQKSFFWGYRTENGVSIGTPEKAFYDLLYIRGVRTKEIDMEGFRSLLEDMDTEMFNRKLLHEYGNRFGGRTKHLAGQLGVITI